MAESPKLYTVKWPRSPEHKMHSQSGVFVETNLQRQLVLHFYNEYREIEDRVDYSEEGVRQSEPREITYVREVTHTILVGEHTALQLRDMLNALYPAPPAEDIN